MTLVISKGLTLDNGTRAAAIAGVSPTLDYRFAREKREIETISLTDKLTYTGGNGTFVGSDGFIQRAATNVPRFDHDPLSRRSLGLLSEAERTNLLQQSEDLSTAWFATRSSVFTNTEMAPNGTTTADTLVEDTSASATHFIGQSISVTSGVSYVFSVFIKRALGSRDANLRWSGGVAAGNMTVNLATGAVSGSSAIQNPSAVVFPNGWWRVSFWQTATSTGSFGVQIFLHDGAGIAYTGDGTSGIYIWGAQVEAASTPSTYIPTTSAAVTRTADSGVIDGTGVITGTYTMVEKPAGCAVVSGSNINLQPGFRAERVMVFPAALDAGQITAIRGAM